MPDPCYVVVEGATDESMARAVVKFAGGDVLKVIVAGGKSKLDQLLPSYSRAAAYYPWVVFRDSDGECPVNLSGRLLDNCELTGRFELRIAVSMTEAWLMADRTGFAEFFSVSPDTIDRTPENYDNAKSALLKVCSRSRSRRIREGLVAGGHYPGPQYMPMLDQFAAEKWCVQSACENSLSLRRAVERISQTVGT